MQGIARIIHSPTFAGSGCPTGALLSAVLVFCASLMPGAVGAQEARDADERIVQWEKTIEHAERSLATNFADAERDAVRQNLRDVREAARALRGTAEARRDAIREQLDRLGPPPAEDEDRPPEAESIAALREDLRSTAAAEDAIATQARLVEGKASDLLEEFARWEQERFRETLLHRGPAPVWPSIWTQAAADAVVLLRSLVTAPAAWWENHRTDQNVWTQVVLIMLLGLLTGWPLRRWLMRRFGRDPDDQDPSYARRIVAATADGLANALIPAAMIGLILLALSLQGLLTGLLSVMVYSGTTALAGFLVAVGLSRAALSPHMVAWRIVPVAPAHALALLRAIRLVAAVMAASLAILVTASYSGHRTEALESVFFLLQTVTLGLLMAWLLSPHYWIASVEESREAGTIEEARAAMTEEDAEEQPPGNGNDTRDWLDLGRWLLRAAVLLAPLIALVGYSRLAYFVQSRLVMTAALLGAALLIRLAVRELVERFFLLRSHGRPVARTLTLWTTLTTDLVLALGLLYVLLLLYGVPVTMLGLWTTEFLAGIRIGTIHIAPGNVLVALLLLAAGLVLTNLVRRWLAVRVLPNTRLDFGARNSIAAGTSYLGISIAALVAISALGIDFSNLALVAGALSLGIGFGLRNLVENFAAGILLLIERPIRTGDWVVVGETEGTVRHISVRSTEIETFDRASVIVPNSELIAKAVTNWTHTNRMARITVKVSVAYGSDTRHVAAVLQQCAEDHPMVLNTPEPAAYLLAFGDSGLDFQLRCFIGDSDQLLTAISDLHFAVDRAFREQGIVIPFPQRDLHLHRRR